MGWSIGYDENWKRDIGYGVPAVCDHPGCNAEIDRGLEHVCGSEPKGGDHGCGLYFCSAHLKTAGNKRDNSSLCSKCYQGKGHTFTPKPDTLEWIRWKLTDESWAQWGAENPEQVAKMADIAGGEVMSAMLREPGLLKELAAAKDLIQRMALHIENPDETPALLWGLQGIKLVVEADTLLSKG